MGILGAYEFDKLYTGDFNTLNSILVPLLPAYAKGGIYNTIFFTLGIDLINISNLFFMKHGEKSVLSRKY